MNEFCIPLKNVGGLDVVGNVSDYQRVCFILHALRMPYLGLPLLPPSLWAMKMVTTKAIQETTRARHAG